MKDKVNDPALVQVAQLTRLHAEEGDVMGKKLAGDGEKEREDSGQDETQRNEGEQRTPVADQLRQQSGGVA